MSQWSLQEKCFRKDIDVILLIQKDHKLFTIYFYFLYKSIIYIRYLLLYIIFNLTFQNIGVEGLTNTRMIRLFFFIQIGIAHGIFLNSKFFRKSNQNHKNLSENEYDPTENLLQLVESLTIGSLISLTINR